MWFLSGKVSAGHGVMLIANIGSGVGRSGFSAVFPLLIGVVACHYFLEYNGVILSVEGDGAAVEA